MSQTKWEALTAWVKFGAAVRTLNIGMLPGPCVVLNPIIGVVTAFNSTNDLLEVGHSTDPDAFGTAYDLNVAADLDEFTPGVELGYRLSGKDVILTYTPSGTAATQGHAIVIVPFLRIPFQP